MKKLLIIIIVIALISGIIFFIVKRSRAANADKKISVLPDGSPVSEIIAGGPSTMTDGETKKLIADNIKARPLNPKIQAIFKATAALPPINTTKTHGKIKVG